MDLVLLYLSLKRMTFTCHKEIFPGRTIENRMSQNKHANTGRRLYSTTYKKLFLKSYQKCQSWYVVAPEKTIVTSSFYFNANFTAKIFLLGHCHVNLYTQYSALSHHLGKFAECAGKPDCKVCILCTQVEMA